MPEIAIYLTRKECNNNRLGSAVISDVTNALIDGEEGRPVDDVIDYDGNGTDESRM